MDARGKNLIFGITNVIFVKKFGIKIKKVQHEFINNRHVLGHRARKQFWGILFI